MDDDATAVTLPFDGDDPLVDDDIVDDASLNNGAWPVGLSTRVRTKHLFIHHNHY